MGIFEAIILGIVEGFTEFLPISSTAHLVITSRLLGLFETDFVKTFIIAIQLGAIASVVVLYWRTLVYDRTTLRNIAIAFTPTAIIGFLLYKLIKGVLFESLPTIAVALLVGGIILILFERNFKQSADKELTHITARQAFLIGCAQSLAVVPGVSRAAATIIGGMLLGVSRESIVTFSFLLAIPTMVAATGYDLIKTAPSLTGENTLILLIGAAVSFVFAIIGVRFFIKIIKSTSFIPFGTYRIALAVLLGLWMLL